MILRKIVFLITAFAFIQGQAQKLPRMHKRVAFFSSLNPKKLALRLTAGKYSDQEKVDAIHSWIVYNIKYDVKKYTANDYKVTSLKKVLRQRKAVCVGYCHLMEALCSYVGVKCVTVPGYSKNIETDACDSLYLDDHCWNAVKIDGRWKLLDPTWNAGYITFYRHGFFNKLKYIFSLGRNNQMKYRPRFHRNPETKFYLKTGNEFAYDHLSVIPLWQMVDEPFAMEDWQEDSTFYLREMKKSDAYSDPEDWDGQRDDFHEKDQMERLKEYGWAGCEFNGRNQLGAGIADYICGKQFEKIAMEKMTDTVAFCRQVDSVEFYLKRSMVRHDSAGKLIMVEKLSLLRNIKAKNEKMKVDNKLVMQVMKHAQKDAESGGKMQNKYANLANTKTQNNKENVKQFLLKTGIYTTMPAKQRYALDSTAAAIKVDSVNRILRFSNDTFDRLLVTMENQYNAVLMLLQKHTEYMDSLRGYTMAVVKYRYAGLDDNDYEIQQLKKLWLTNLKYHDSALYVNRVLMFDTMMRSVKFGFSYIGKMNTMYKSAASIYIEMKKKCVASSSDAIIAAYVSNLEKTKDLHNYFSSWLITHNYVCIDIQKVSGHLEAIAKHGQQVLKQEATIKILAKSLNQRFSSLSKLNLKQRIEADKSLKKMLALKRKNCK